MLISVSRDRSECFDFSNRIQPDFYAAAVGATPALQRKSNLHRVKQRDIKDAHKPVVTRVIQISQRVQSGDASRGRLTMGEKPRLQLLKHGGFKLFGFDAVQQ